MAEDKNLEKDSLFTDEEILDHEYDGIKEMNNGMPFWLTWLFIGSIIFGVIYYLHYESGAGIEVKDQFLADMQKHKTMMAAGNTGNENYWESLKNEEGLKIGAEVYKLRCVACHGQKGEGGIGPNLADTYWIHGKASTEEIAELIDKGVTEKGMPAWGSVISQKELVAVTYFVESLKGSNPPNAKEPQGELVE
jgi:cytochrome c oxidase cbb3-type subunit 3